MLWLCAREHGGPVSIFGGANLLAFKGPVRHRILLRMRALVVYICASVDGALGGGPGTAPSAPTESRPNPISTQVVESGSCGLCAYVDEPDAPLRQFFRGLNAVKGTEKDTTSNVMRLGQAPSAWVLGPGLPTSSVLDSGETTFDLGRDAGVPVREGLHDVYREPSVEGVGRRVSSLLGASCGSSGTSGQPPKDVIYVLHRGDTSILEQMLSHVDTKMLDGTFVALVVEQRGQDLAQIVNRHAPCRFRPPQSFTFRGSVSVPIRHDLLSAMVYRGPRNPPPGSNASTRVDGVARLDDPGLVYAEGCGSCVLAERVLFEVAYKIGWSDKFGS